jgi:hypothetical protein
MFDGRGLGRFTQSREAFTEGFERREKYLALQRSGR